MSRASARRLWRARPSHRDQRDAEQHGHRRRHGAKDKVIAGGQQPAAARRARQHKADQADHGKEKQKPQRGESHCRQHSFFISGAPPAAGKRRGDRHIAFIIRGRSANGNRFHRDRMNFSRRGASAAARMARRRKNLEILQEIAGETAQKLEGCRLDTGDYPNCYVERFSTDCGKPGGDGGKNRVKNGFPHFQQGFQQRLGKLWNYSAYNPRSSAPASPHPAQYLHF